MTVRTRVAPSPTGDPHVGTAYIALFNWAFAKSQGGEFLLRIEDTDQARSSRKSEEVIFAALKWLGLSWDEGPDIGGAKGPYRQSERREIYQEYANQLVDEGHAFACFCSPDKLSDLRNKQMKAGDNPGYDGHCLRLSPSEVEQRIVAGESHVIRMKVPVDGVCTFQDVLRGDIEIPYSQVDMQVLQKSDGMPTYHLAVVVDDHLMEITHVLRGEEWINSMPKHQLLYAYFGWQMPVHCHLPLLRNPDKSKLSKRKHPTSINYYRDVGYLPEALLNYLGLMGWSMPDESEVFSKEDMQNVFNLERISLGGPIFDIEKLNWLNGQYLRELSDDVFMDKLQSWMVNRDRLAQIVPLIKERTERFADIAPRADYLLGDRKPLSTLDFSHKLLDENGCRQILDHLLRAFDGLSNWSKDPIYDVCLGLSGAMEIEIRDFLFPLFIAVTGREVSLPLFDSMVYLGKDVCRVRIREAIEALGGISKKQAKKLEKNYRSLVV